VRTPKANTSDVSFRNPECPSATRAWRIHPICWALLIPCCEHMAQGCHSSSYTSAESRGWEHARKRGRCRVLDWILEKLARTFVESCGVGTAWPQTKPGSIQRCATRKSLPKIPTIAQHGITTYRSHAVSRHKIRPPPQPLSHLSPFFSLRPCAGTVTASCCQKHRQDSH
jgi:hypothetical protein